MITHRGYNKSARVRELARTAMVKYNSKSFCKEVQRVIAHAKKGKFADQGAFHDVIVAVYNWEEPEGDLEALPLWLVVMVVVHVGSNSPMPGSCGPLAISSIFVLSI